MLWFITMLHMVYLCNQSEKVHLPYDQSQQLHITSHSYQFPFIHHIVFHTRTSIPLRFGDTHTLTHTYYLSVSLMYTDCHNRTTVADFIWCLTDINNHTHTHITLMQNKIHSLIHTPSSAIKKNSATSIHSPSHTQCCESIIPSFLLLYL